MKKRTTQKEPLHKQDDDLWAWAVIGLIFVSVTLLYAALVWQATHSSL
jgi:hypothetical protein